MYMYSTHIFHHLLNIDHKCNPTKARSSGAPQWVRSTPRGGRLGKKFKGTAVINMKNFKEYFRSLNWRHHDGWGLSIMYDLSVRDILKRNKDVVWHSPPITRWICRLKLVHDMELQLQSGISPSTAWTTYRRRLSSLKTPIIAHTSNTAQGGSRSFKDREGHYRRGELLWCMGGKANPLMDRKVVVVVFFFRSMVAVVTSPTTAGCSVV